ncbi:hypothetical protein BJ912DRAFT_851352, partial [Pholiota molesta]
MLIIFLVLALTRTLYGVSISSLTETSRSFTSPTVRDVQLEDQFGSRTLNDIILSCCATIVACTWSAVHPNNPSPTDCWWTGFKRRVVIMVYALLAPEAIAAWALRQQLEEGEVPRWTLTHGFFLQMGGFILCKNGRPVQSLTTGFWNAEEARLDWNIENGTIDPPQITEEEIKDRSKGDAISKTFVILQTTWFVAQCVARWSQHLLVTELEVVTLGFALLNGITYALWWNKPQNVGQPVRLEAK